MQILRETFIPTLLTIIALACIWLCRDLAIRENNLEWGKMYYANLAKPCTWDNFSQLGGNLPVGTVPATSFVFDGGTMKFEDKGIHFKDSK